MTQLIGIRGNHRSLGPAIALGLLAAAIAAAPAAAARPAVTHVINIGFHVVQHFDADPSCGPYSVGVTEIADGNDHLVIVDDGTRLAITFGETFRITAIPDDPTIASNTRQGTDAGHFLLKRNGDLVVHESFHDYGVAAWDLDAKIRLATTFITHNGEVQVDHGIFNDMPPDGC
jgi:hypothetical protein